MHYNKFLACLEGFFNQNWVTNNDEVMSTSGYLFILGAGAISLKSSKQTCRARSTMEEKFIALELARQEVWWLRNILLDMPLWGRQDSPIHLHCDSREAIGIAKKKVCTMKKKKHLCIRHGAVK